MKRLALAAVGLALVVGLLVCSAPLVRAQPVATIALPPPGGSVQLYSGCNNIALTFPSGTASQTVVDAVTPAGAVEAIWRYNAAQNTFEAFSPAAPQASDLLSVDFLDAVWLCLAGAPPAAPTSPAATPTATPPASPTPGTSPKPTPSPTASPTPTGTAGIPAGLPHHLSIGLANKLTELSWMTASGIPWDYRYQYLTGGVNTGQGWTTWNSPPGAFADMYLNDSGDSGYIPVFTYYQVVASAPSPWDQNVSLKLQNASTMAAYYQEWKLLMQKAGAYGRSGGSARGAGPVGVYAVPLWGQRRFGAGPGGSLRVCGGGRLRGHGGRLRPGAGTSARRLRPQRCAGLSCFPLGHGHGPHPQPRGPGGDGGPDMGLLSVVGGELRPHLLRPLRPGRRATTRSSMGMAATTGGPMLTS